MLRTVAIIVGILFIFAGVAGFIPSFTTNGLLFDYFMVDSLHNAIHIITGVLAIMAATSYAGTRLYFQVFGIIYLIVAIVGFVRGGDLFIMQTNTADNFLHLGFAVIALYFGFLTKRRV